MTTTYTPGPEALDHARQALQAATSALLGATIQVSDEDWAAPSALPDWSRAELAAHIARHADAMRGIVEGALRGEVVPLYPSPEAREEGIRAGAGRTGLQVQEDLDAACGNLDDAFDRVEDWSAPVDLRGTVMPLALLPFGRLAEVVLHHVDLAIGLGLEDLDAEVAGLVLDWATLRIATKPDVPALRLVADSGRSWIVPGSGEPAEVTGTPQHLLGWLTGRSGPEAVEGADGIVVPSW